MDKNNNEYDLPIRSKKPISETTPEKKVEKIISGTAVKQKKGLWAKFKETFVGKDAGNVKNYIIWDVLVPAAKATLDDIVSSGVKMILFGEVRPNNVRRERGRSYVSYDKAWNSRDRTTSTRESSSTNRARHIILGSRSEAEDVLSFMSDLIVSYGQATVGDLLSLVGMTTAFTDESYGWDDLSRASVSRVPNGYLIQVPRPILLDK
jgi:hypothetical protein